MADDTHKHPNEVDRIHPSGMIHANHDRDIGKCGRVNERNLEIGRKSYHRNANGKQADTDVVISVFDRIFWIYHRKIDAIWNQKKQNNQHDVGKNFGFPIILVSVVSQCGMKQKLDHIESLA